MKYRIFAWTQRKLGDVADIVAGGDIDKSKLCDSGKYPVIANALTNGGIVGYYEDDYRIEAPAVTVTGRGDVGFAQARKVNFTPVVRLLAVQSNFDVDFLANAINQFDIFVESTGVPQLTSPQLASYEIIYTNIEEQTVIGTFFRTLDELITTSHRQVTLLKRLKAAYLQQMFPQAGEKVPRVRFEGFSGEWAETRLSDIVDITSGIAGDTSMRSGAHRVTRIETISNGTIDMQKLGFVADKPDLCYKLNQGDILYSNINSIEHIGKVALFEEEQDVYHGINLLRLSTASVAPSFLYTYLLTQRAITWAKSHANKAVSQASINQTALSGQVLYVPSYAEQKTIGNFFRSLDEQISTQQIKLDTLKQLKVSYLQKMFV